MQVKFSGEVFVSSCTQQLHGGRCPMVIDDDYSSLWNKNPFRKPNWTMVSIKIIYKRCLVNRVQVASLESVWMQNIWRFCLSPSPN